MIGKNDSLQRTDATLDLAGWRNLSRQRIPSSKHSDEVRDASINMDPKADLAITREARSLVLRADPTYWLDDRSLLAWLARVTHPSWWECIVDQPIGNGMT